MPDRKDPLVSIVMSVYNTEKDYLKLSIESILNQTFKDYEFIIVNDGSESEIGDLLEEYHDERIIIMCNHSNMGLTKSLNRAIGQMRGQYLARMDADDIALPDRLEKQYLFMEKHPEIGVLGCWTEWDNNISKWYGGSSTKWRKIGMLFDNCGVCHSSAFIRMSAFNKEDKYYDELFPKAQDYELWTRLIKHEKFYVYPEVLMQYRWHSGQITVDKSGEQNQCRNTIRLKLLYELSDNISYIEKEQFLHLEKEVMDLREVSDFYSKLSSCNKIKRIYEIKMFQYELIQRWWLYCKKYFWKDKKKSVIKYGMFWKMFIPGYWCFRIWRFWTINQFERVRVK